MQKKFWVWEFIKESVDAYGELVGYTCEECKKTFSKESATSTFVYHLVHVHKKHRLSAENESNERQLTLDQTSSIPMTNKQLTQINKSLIKMIACQNLPLYFCESRFFRNFCETLNISYTPPSYKTCRELIIREAEDIKKCISENMTKINSASIACDLWTSESYDSFLGIKVFYSKDFKLMHHTLCCKPLSYPHTADNISNAIAEELLQYGLYDKTKFIVTDNAANMISAGKKLSMINIPCVIHTIQLSVKVFLEKMQQQIENCRKLCLFFRKSPKQRQRLNDFRKFLKRDKELEIVVDEPTRWNSTEAMVKRLLEMNDDIMLLRNNLKESKVFDDINDGNQLENYLNSLGISPPHYLWNKPPL